MADSVATLFLNNHNCHTPHYFTHNLPELRYNTVVFFVMGCAARQLVICVRRLQRACWLYLQRSKSSMDSMALKAGTATRNIRHQSLSDRTPNPRRYKASTAPLRKPEKSRNRKCLTHSVGG